MEVLHNFQIRILILDQCALKYNWLCSIKHKRSTMSKVWRFKHLYILWLLSPRLLSQPSRWHLLKVVGSLQSLRQQPHIYTRLRLNEETTLTLALLASHNGAKGFFEVAFNRAFYMGELRNNTTSSGTITKKPGFF